jgi:hypothetical protein
MSWRDTAVVLCISWVVACDDGEDDGHDHDHDHDEETEVISRVVLTFTPEGGGAPVTAAFEDPDGDGGVSGTTDPITLPSATTYALGIQFLNGLVDPPEDIGEEVAGEAEDHMVLLLGSAVTGPASSSTSAVLEHAYADKESDYGDNATGADLPVGLKHTITTIGMGGGDLRVTLRHLPPVDGTVQKTEGIPEQAAMGAALPGDADVDVSFDVTVQ